MSVPTPYQPLLVVIAGCNGSGKTTFYERFLASTELPYVNPDVIAKDLNGLGEEERAGMAAALAETLRQNYFESGQSFITETVLSDPVGDKVAKFAAAQVQGYWLDVHYIGLASAFLSQARVMDRVERGGHDVPDDRLLARYPRTLRNLTRLLDVADRLSIYDNSEVDRPFRLVAILESGVLQAIADSLPTWLEPLDLVIRPHALTTTLD